jgi:ferrous iron transport protein A
MGLERDVHARAGGGARQPVTLADLSPGATRVVGELPRGHRVVSRMSALGFTPGTEVTVVRNDRHRPLIVLVRGTRVAIGRGEAAKVIMETARDGQVPGPPA